MKKTALTAIVLCLVCALLLGGCGVKSGLDPKNPITLTMWHNFGGDMQKTMDTLIDEFNSTVGKEAGIIINVTAITSSAELQETLSSIVNGDPGAPAMPDITTSYPKTAVLFQSRGLLADLDRYFTAEELAAYVPAFLDEGRFGDGGLYVFPFAKSTEILYLNQTLFDRFAAETGVTMDCFATFEGIAAAARKYYAWSGGKQFFAADSWVNLAQAGMRQQGSALFDGESLHLDDPAYAHIWQTLYDPAALGGFAIYDGYSSDLSKTGDLVCSTGSSAGILFYGDTITYADNTVEEVEYNILPFPVFEGGSKIAIQRGNGLCVAASDETRESAAAIFFKWFTQPAQNMRFISSTGYLPVTNEAFEVDMEAQMSTVEDARIRKMLSAVMEMHADYEFFTAPTFESFDAVSKAYEKNFKAFFTAEQETLAGGAPPDAQEALVRWAALN